MAAASRGLAVLLILVFGLVWAGCSTVSGNSIDDSKIVSALKLQKVDSGYEINGEPFCRIDQLLNDVDEVKAASKKKGVDFVIAAHSGAVGVLAHRPFAPACKREASDALKQLARQAKKSD